MKTMQNMGTAENEVIVKENDIHRLIQNVLNGIIVNVRDDILLGEIKVSSKKRNQQPVPENSGKIVRNMMKEHMINYTHEKKNLIVKKFVKERPTKSAF